MVHPILSNLMAILHRLDHPNLVVILLKLLSILKTNCIRRARKMVSVPTTHMVALLHANKPQG